MATPRRILILDGHPRSDSLCRALGEAYERGARSAGLEVRRLVLADLAFDPVLRGSHTDPVPLEPDVVAAQDHIRWADHLVFVHPVWWSDLPALLKGFLDRVFLPGFAFAYRKGSPLPQKLLKGRSARILHTMDAPPWYYRWFQGAPGLKALSVGTLAFCGVAPVRATAFTPVRSSTPATRERWLRRAEALGAKGA
jgi:putative NADPH-quinone reductase